MPKGQIEKEVFCIVQRPMDRVIKCSESRPSNEEIKEFIKDFEAVEFKANPLLYLFVEGYDLISYKLSK